MTVTVTLELTPIQEAELRAGLAHQDKTRIRQLLLDALEPTITDLLEKGQENEVNSQSEWDALSTLLANELAARLPPDFQGLSDYAVSREGIYDEHP